MAGPAYCAAAVPVSTKIPAPMIAPMPSVVRFSAPSARLSVCSAPSPRCFGLQHGNALLGPDTHAEFSGNRRM